MLLLLLSIVVVLLLPFSSFIIIINNVIKFSDKLTIQLFAQDCRLIFTYGIQCSLWHATIYKVCIIFLSDGVKEYLRLSTDANKTQLQRIKSLFEKRNQKSAQTIAELQAKLEVYMKRIQELEMAPVDVQKEPHPKKTVGFKWA